ncbi:MAG: ABC transporter substrate-binding protein [Mesorhizobium sp.]|uniref:ABC transporter substrate-binding protein n=1 Tax=Mesorhizobium sp. TaxID=1871066 RepID=UPI000FE86656|nr:ABC transporter substrate-binding protein [Mesorhizobium sp.]RWI57056.1 MAG: ABC transporter substrate-binding protein [Mesorhizobium sp.]
MNNRGYTRRTILRTGVAAGGTLALPGLLSRRSYAQAETIRIGFVSPRTGPVAAFGASDDYVLKQVREVIGVGIEINGRTYPVEIITKDTQSNPNRAAEVVNQLMLEDQVDLMLASSTADTTNPVADQCELNEIPCISTDTPWDGHFFGRGGDPSTGFDWTYHFFWGASQLVNCYTSLWDQLPTNKKVGVLWSNDSDGVPLSNDTTGLPPLFAKNGYEVIDAGFHQPLSDDFSAQIAKLKAAEVDIVSGVFLPPDFTTFWIQAAQQGFRPKAATVAKALLFPSAVETLGSNGNGVSSEVWWSPDHPYTSGLTGINSADLARGYEAMSGQQWIQPTGYKHALLEVAIDVLKRSDNPKDKGAVRDAIRKTNYRSIVGPISWASGPVKNACQTPLVGGQWLAGSDGRFDLVICENSSAPEIAVQKAFAAL